LILTSLPPLFATEVAAEVVTEPAIENVATDTTTLEGSDVIQSNESNPILNHVTQKLEAATAVSEKDSAEALKDTSDKAAEEDSSKPILTDEKKGVLFFRVLFLFVCVWSFCISVVGQNAHMPIYACVYVFAIVNPISPPPSQSWRPQAVQIRSPCHPPTLQLCHGEGKSRRAGTSPAS
jgi:hypothetical protein